MAGSDGELSVVEIVATLSLAADLALGMELEHGLRSAIVAMRLADELGVDAATGSQVYYVCLLFYVGCTADAEVAAETFAGESSLLTHVTPVMFGSPREAMTGVLRAVAPPERPGRRRAVDLARRLPRAVRGHRPHLRAICEVAEMLTERLGLSPSVHSLFAHLTDRWDGRGGSDVGGESIPLAVRIAHVARDATFQHELGGAEHAAAVIRARGGRAFDPAISEVLARHGERILRMGAGGSVWEAALACEPKPQLWLTGDTVDRALTAIADFADLGSPFLAGHSRGVAALAAAGAARWRLSPAEVAGVRRAGLVHDVGRVSVPVAVWHTPGAFRAGDWERVRLHPYWTERVLARSPILAACGSVAAAHHERLDGSGYHRAVTAAGLGPAARLLAAADAFQAMTEPRPHRGPLATDAAASTLTAEAAAGHLDPGAVAAVLEAAGRRAPRMQRPGGLTEREAEVVGLLARGLQTKQIARALGISAKTADTHIQNAYAKIGVSTRAAATVFAMANGIVASGELPMAHRAAGP